MGGTGTCRGRGAHAALGLRLSPVIQIKLVIGPRLIGSYEGGGICHADAHIQIKLVIRPRLTLLVRYAMQVGVIQIKLVIRPRLIAMQARAHK